MGNQNSCPCVKSTVDEVAVTHSESKRDSSKEMRVRDFDSQNSHTSDNSDHESDDEVLELPQFAPGQYVNKRASVSAGHIDFSRFQPPVYPKSAEERQYLHKILRESFLFSSLDAPTLEKVIDALEKELVQYNDQIITQGDEGDCLYVVDSGDFTCYKILENNESKELITCTRGDTFGELALLYNAPRAASVRCTSQVGGVVWRLDRLSFSALVIGAARLKRDLHASFLEKIQSFSVLDVYEKSQLVDALKSHIWMPNEIIIREGEEGERFYILKKGHLQATKKGKRVETYTKPGDFFGELALIKVQPRAATVSAVEMSEGLSIEKKTFHRLLGPLEVLLKDREVGYNQADRMLMTKPTSLEMEVRKGTVLEGISTGLL
eukprot:GDKJ01025778.1.p1 GENE.GDKJ01025778.1~~GDKJ01025778.1.p1  ORF type:complete len:379 (-),score=76.02 GDKJ01025778.1:425-1561(-)